MNTRIRRGISAVIALSIASAAVLATSAPAMATEVEPTRVEAELTFTPWTVEKLEEFGFEVRYNEDGQAYGVPEGTPAGSMVGATDPIVEDIALLAAMDEACGVAWLEFAPWHTFHTGYNVLPSSGAPISHIWNVAVHSSIDFLSFDLGGLAPWGSQSWEASRVHGVQYRSGSYLNAMAGGWVVTTAGVCYTNEPTASIKP